MVATGLLTAKVVWRHCSHTRIEIVGLGRSCSSSSGRGVVQKEWGLEEKQ